MIPRYTRPDMGRIWSDENRFRTWLAVEVAATETLAEAGMVPKDAARAIRERADFNLDRIAEIEAEVRHDVIAFTTAVAEIVGAARPLVSLRTDFERRSRHLAGPAHPAGLRDYRRRPGKAFRCARTARVGVQRHAHDRAHPRHPRRAHHVWFQAGQLVLRDPAQYRALSGRRRRHAGGKIFRGRRHIRPPQPGTGREHVRAAGIESCRHFIPGDPARSPCGVSRYPGRHCLHSGQDRHRAPPLAAHRSARSRGVLQRKAEGLVRHAAQAEPDHPGTDQRSGAGGAFERAGGVRKRGVVA